MKWYFEIAASFGELLEFGFRTDAGTPFDLLHPFHSENFHGRTHLARRAKGMSLENEVKTEVKIKPARVSGKMR